MANQTFSADQIVGKTLVANQDIAVYRSPQDSATKVYTAKAGQVIGTVSSWINPGEGKSYLNWMFYDSNGRPFYTRHKPGVYSVRNLKEQGALTIKDQKKLEDEAKKKQERENESLLSWAERNVKTVALIIAGALVVKEVIPNFFKGKK